MEWEKDIDLFVSGYKVTAPLIVNRDQKLVTVKSSFEEITDGKYKLKIIFDCSNDMYGFS